MDALSAAQVLDMWDRGEARGPIERALLLLAEARAHWPRERLRGVPLGQRDVCVLALRSATLGSQIRGYLRCGACGELLQFEVDTAQVCFAAVPQQMSELRTVAVAMEGYEVAARLPDSEDMALASQCPDVVAARALLIERCVIEARRGGAVVAVEALPPAVVRELGEAIGREDPQVEVFLDLSCVSCGRVSKALLDAPAFFWDELDKLADTLMTEIEVLAREYGWREEDILAMSAARRRRYMARCQDG